MKKRKYKVNSLDIEMKHIPILEEWLSLLKEEKKIKGAGICVPIKSRLHYLANGDYYYNEWEPSRTWDPNRMNINK